MTFPRLSPPRGLLTVLLASAAISFFLLLPSRATAASPTQVTSTPSPQPTPTLDPAVRLQRPAVSDPPTQVEEGALKYWGVCMACHGDRAQGLTDEWRTVYGEDSNCWASGCHGTHIPPWGFEIPKDRLAPAMTGAGTLARFNNAQELKDYIKETMPWWNPGSLKEDEAWAVTAYILKIRNSMPENVELGAATASAITVQYAAASHGDERPAILFFAIVIVLATLGWTAQDLLRTKRENSMSAPDEKKPIEKPNFFHHLHPPTIPAAQARLRYTLGAGGLAVFLSLILLVTGILEMFYYLPVPERAAISVQTITSLVPFGGLTRNLHFWSAQALVIVMFVHLLRVILTGAYARQRRLNYLIGLGMLAAVLLLDFTGYVLRWDEGIRWALIVGTNLLKIIPGIGHSLYQLVVGGSSPGSSSVERFYTWHIFVLTFGYIILGVWHIFRTRRDGGIAVPPPETRNGTARISRFELVRREVLMMLAAGLVLLVVSTLFPAPIEMPMTQATAELGDARAPWFFLWVQELLKLGDPFLWGVLAPIVTLILMALLPYIFPEARDSELGSWLPRGNRIAQIAAMSLILTFILLTILSTFSSAQP
ncbi:MAG: cytochrome b N-terminal domain-containing protein [Chloroflexi bacterium]|nr:cytochrome b N-terminal domain-containing protein [Chloroflexota bacterium]